MVVKAEQERVKSLIADTVSLLCKNGLHYTKEFCIEGLLGITLDQDEVFLVNIKEIVKTELGAKEEDSDSAALSEEEEEARRTAKSRKRKKKKRKHHHNSRASGGGSDQSDNETNSSFAQGGNTSDCGGEPANKNIKQELEDDSGDDLVFVKDEPGSDRGACSFGGQINISGANILGDMSQQGQLYATPSSNPLPGPSWDTTLQQQQSPFNPASQPPNAASSTIGSLGQPGQQMDLAVAVPLPPATSAEGGSMQCPLCPKVMRSVNGFHMHINSHQGVYPYTCPYCRKGFNSTTTMKEHLTTHTNQNYFKCSRCGQEFRHHYKLRNHKRGGGCVTTAE